jgi:hypothetical protein
MSVASLGGPATATNATKRLETLEEVHYETWHHWPINWSAVWVGALAAILGVLLCGLIGVAVGAQILDPTHRLVDLKKMSFWMLAYSVFSSFLVFVVGGWVAGRTAGALRSEPAILHGVIAWLIAVPLLVVLIGLGAGHALGAWHAGLIGSTAQDAQVPFDKPEPLRPGATEEEWKVYRAELNDYRMRVELWREDTPKVTRNAALGAITALLLGLMGSVVGGWMASGEAMTFEHHHQRKKAERLTRI